VSRVLVRHTGGGEDGLVDDGGEVVVAGGGPFEVLLRRLTYGRR
jgi:hypothetical protein